MATNHLGSGTLANTPSGGTFPITGIPYSQSPGGAVRAATGADYIYISPGGLHFIQVVDDNGNFTAQHVATTYNVTLSATNVAGTGSAGLAMTVYR